ncbi:DNA / pantothenate metabolism flavoprotein [Cooperia oncophora]
MHLPRIKEAIELRAMYKDRILYVPFSTLESYFFYLDEISRQLVPLKSRALLYLAAAVSDFYIEEEKIANATKFNRTIETDDSILISKARGALEKYKHQLVIGNILQTRKVHVVLVDAHNTEDIDLNQRFQSIQEQMKNGVEIEEKIIAKVKERHIDFMKNHGC